jgi:hypothetical protein
MSDGSHVRWRVSFVALFVLYITTGVIFYTQYEKWTFVTALYFTTVTLCTVGYGDQLPSDQSYVFLVRPTAAQTPIAETTTRAPGTSVASEQVPRWADSGVLVSAAQALQPHV